MSTLETKKQIVYVHPKDATETEHKILIFMTESTQAQAQAQGTSTLAIAKHMFGIHATCKQVNPSLYAMQKKGWIEKTVPQPPMWSRKQK